MTNPPDPKFSRRARSRDRLALLASALIALATAPLHAQAKEPATLQPYKARYQVHFRGLSGGQIESSLSRSEVPGQWLYETRAYPSLLGRVAVSPNARESSVMQITPAGVRPLSFDFNDGSAGTTKDVRFKFDWAAGRVRGEAEGVPFDLPVGPGTQDTASVQAAMITDLLAGRSPQSYPILTGRKLREYRYWPEGRQTVMTPYGQFDTVVWANQRDGSTRITKVWHAPSLGYVPVQAVQYRKGQAETRMQMVALERTQGQ